MKETLLKWKDNATTFWKNQSKQRQGIYIGAFVLALMLIIGIVILASSNNSNYVPLYSNLSLQEANQIKTELDARGVPYELQNNSTTITVPEEEADGLLVDLAGMGIPDSGNIDYSYFSENSSWGITDNEFDIMRLDAMQTELANLITSIQGIRDAQVMINMPEEPVFADETAGEASASIVIHTEPGYQFAGNQINALYHLVSRAVPNLPAENIVIMNQNFEYFDQNSSQGSMAQGAYSQQQAVKQEVESDIQQRVQQMLAMMLGRENVIVSVTTDIDFTQENRTEELVEPVNPENMEGIPVSAETIQESYSGTGGAGGTAGTGEEDVTNYPGAAEGEDGEYELNQETINYEFNRIRRDIVESPYKIRDLGIQVAINNTRVTEDGEAEYLSPQQESSVEDGVSSILDSIISTSVNAAYEEEGGAPAESTSIVFQEFASAESTPETAASGIPTWIYIVGGILLAIIILLSLLMFRSRATDKEEDIYSGAPIPEEDFTQREEPEQESEAITRRKKLEKAAKENPEDFAKLLRSWLGDD